MFSLRLLSFFVLECGEHQCGDERGGDRSDERAGRRASRRASHLIARHAKERGQRTLALLATPFTLHIATANDGRRASRLVVEICAAALDTRAAS